MIVIKYRPVSVNEAYTGKRYATPILKKYKISMSYLLPRKIKVYEKMNLDVIFFYKNNASRDVDNGVKPLMDILQNKYDFNDKNIHSIRVEKVKAKYDAVAFRITEYKPSELAKKIKTAENL